MAAAEVDVGQSILELTRDIVELYLYSRGLSETPREFDEWSCLTLISACLGDRVWKTKGLSQVRPNLYTFLIGPSGLGKGEAIDMATGYAECFPPAAVDVFRGEITAKGLLRYLGRKTKDNAAHPTFFLICEEMGMSVGEGPLARDFIKGLTGLYKGSHKYRKATSDLADTVKIEKHNIVTLFGSTRPWIIESVPRSAIEGGWFARTAAIEADYHDVRYPTPVVPPDVGAVQAHLHARFAHLCGVAGEFVLTSDAQELHDHWYEERPRPVDEAILPSWRREDDLVYKLSMLVACAEGLDEGLVVTAKQWTRARQLAARAMRNVPALIRYASQTPETEKLDMVARTIQRAGRIPHSVLLRALSGRGVDAKMLNERLLPTLLQERRIAVVNGSAMRTYEWLVRRAATRPEPRGDDDASS